MPTHYGNGSDLMSKLGKIIYIKHSYKSKIYPRNQVEPQHEISNNVICATSKASDQPTHTHSLIRAIASRSNILWMLSF